MAYRSRQQRGGNGNIYLLIKRDAYSAKDDNILGAFSDLGGARYYAHWHFRNDDPENYAETVASLPNNQWIIANFKEDERGYGTDYSITRVALDPEIRGSLTKSASKK
jgi:hypothetical protein